MENKKATFITIIVLLCVFAPLTIIGFINKDDKKIFEENPNHETFYKGYIWFYDDNDKFLSKYECQTEICDFTATTIDDTTYGIKNYQNGTITQVPVVDNKYTFITDGALIYLYNVVNGTTLQSYKAVKNYNTNLENDAFIIQNTNGLWGVLTIGDMLSSVLPFEYDFIGLSDNVNVDGTLNTDKFIVLKDSKWYIVNNENTALTGYIDDPIIEYTNEYVFSKNTERVRIYNYENYEYLTNYNINDYILEDKYIGIVTNNFLLIYDNLRSSYIESVTITNVTGDIILEKNDNKLDVKVNNEVIESIELN